MRKIVGSLCTLALLAPMPATYARQDDARRSAPPAEQDLCRTPVALPSLGAEQDQSQQRPEPSRKGRGSSVSEPLMEAPPAPVAVPAPSPPPAPPPPPSASMAGGDSVVVTGSRIDSADRAASAGEAYAVEATADPSRAMPDYPTLPPRPRPDPRPQSGLLTAGEHDDLLNPELYADYVSKSDLGQTTRDLPVLDTGRLLTVEAKDSRGQPMPFVPVEIRCANGKTITLSTVADGRAVFFPGLDRLGRSVDVRAGREGWKRVDLTGAGSQTIGFTMDQRAAPVRKLDLAVVVDVTGSMSDELRYLQSELSAIVDALNRRHRGLDIRVGFTFYRDQGDEFVTRTFPFDSDIEAAKRKIAAQSANGGGDYPEAMQDALIRAANQDWRDDAVKTLLLVADAPPHDQDVELTWRAAEHLRAERVHIVPVGASGVADMAEYVMRAMAAATQSRYTFLTDDSGIGNPHAAPAIDCYLVTKLDDLLRRVIDSQISGRRIEPDAQEIIRTVGKYDAGKCILPADFQANADAKKDA